MISVGVFAFTLLAPLHTFIPGELSLVYNGYKNYRMTKAVYVFAPVMDLVFILFAVAVIYLVFILLKSKQDRILTLSVLVLGMGTRMLMGFSPTVWASGYRTFYILFLAFIIITATVVDRNPQLFKNGKKI